MLNRSEDIIYANQIRDEWGGAWKVNELYDENTRLREVLLFYADSNNYLAINEGMTPVDTDMGDRARLALGLS
jgi:hypothetical protein